MEPLTPLPTCSNDTVAHPPSRHKSSRRVGGRGREVGGPWSPQGGSPSKWGGTEQNHAVTCMVLKAKANDMRKNPALSRDEFRRPRSDISDRPMVRHRVVGCKRCAEYGEWMQRTADERATIQLNVEHLKYVDNLVALHFKYDFWHMTVTDGSDVVQSGRPIFDDFFQHLWPYIGNNTENVVFQMVKRLWLIRIDQ
ncbi:adhesion G protein-coupled receptor B2 [Trichonephila clavipes]|nr:adhesion G protein-coupled receptor B2 [Trichonephila clavipes]